MHFARQGMPEPLPDKAVYGDLDNAATAQLRRARRAADEARITGAHGDQHAVVNDGSNAAAQHDGNDYEEREHSSNDAHHTFEALCWRAHGLIARFISDKLHAPSPPSTTPIFNNMPTIHSI